MDDKKTTFEYDEKSSENMNDPSRWEVRKFNEIFNDPSEQIDADQLEEWAKEQRESTRLMIEKHEAEIALKKVATMSLMVADNIYKYDLFGNLVNIKDNPGFFAESFDELKEKLRKHFCDFRYASQPVPKVYELNNELIALKWGARIGNNEFFVDYFVKKSNNNPRQYNLETIVKWRLL